MSRDRTRTTRRQQAAPEHITSHPARESFGLSGRTDGAGARDRGQPLDGATRTVMDRHFGFDFSNVRIHADHEAAASASELGAAAFAVGPDVYFAQDAYDPGAPSGLHLLAHELTHVVQAEYAPDAAPRGLSAHGDAAEVEASSAANSLFLGQAAPAVGATPATVSMQEEGHHKGGWMDHLFGLDPKRSFVESGMDLLGYGPTGIWGRPTAPGEGDGTTLLRGLGAAAVSPLAGIAAIGGHALDELNHGPSLLHGAFDW